MPASGWQRYALSTALRSLPLPSPGSHLRRGVLLGLFEKLNLDLLGSVQLQPQVRAHRAEEPRISRVGRVGPSLAKLSAVKHEVGGPTESAKSEDGKCIARHDEQRGARQHCRPQQAAAVVEADSESHRKGHRAAGGGGGGGRGRRGERKRERKRQI